MGIEDEADEEDAAVAEDVAQVKQEVDKDDEEGCEAGPEGENEVEADSAVAVKEEPEEQEVAPAKAEEVTVTKSQLNKMKVAELREELEKRGADTKGTKPILLQRLWNVLH